MSLDHIQPPEQFNYHNHVVLLNLNFKFTANNRIFFSEKHYKDLLQHTYTFNISIKSTVNELGLGMDFFEIRKIFNTHIKSHLDGKILNETLPDMNTTVENIAYYLWQQFEKYLPGNNDITTLTLYETPQHSVTLTREIMAE